MGHWAWVGVKKEQVGDTGSHKSSSAVLRVHFDKFFTATAVAVGEQTDTVALEDL